MSGEIGHDLEHASPGTTLMGVGAAGFRRSNSRGRNSGNMFVSAATVEAIAKAKEQARKDEEREARAHREATQKVVVDETALVRMEPIELTPREQRALRRMEGADTLVEQPRGIKRWQEFEDLGLAPRPATRAAQKLVVSTYRLIGFAILSLIVFVLLGYISTTAFYFLNKSWVAPVAVSANDEKVVTLQSQLAAQMNERSKLEGDLEQADRAIAAEQEFQLQFAKAIKADREGRRVALARVQELSNKAARTRAEVTATNGEFSASTADKMGKEYEAGMINRDTMLAGKYQLAQITSANLSLAERQSEFDQRAAELAAQTSSLDAILANKTRSSALSYDVLKIARDYEASKLIVAKEKSNRERLRQSIERQDQIIEGLSQSAHLRALANNATVALVPYDNLKNVEKGTPLYACKISMVWCHQVGKVLDILPGEITLKHPKRESVVRGRMIEMQLTDAEAAHHEVLFLGAPPLRI